MIMVEGLIGKKIGMTQKFDDLGNVIPVTVLKVGPCTVIQKKTKQKDGYAAVQLGLIEEKELRKPNKPRSGHFKKADIVPARVIREVRFDEKSDIKEGSQFFVDIFGAGDKIHITGTSKGKGFAGVIKRWGFHGGKGSHGSMFHRRPGSIGASATPSRVVKGKKMPGQMGNERVTVKNLIVIESDKENNLLVVKGAVPGANRGYVLIKRADFSQILSGEKKPPEIEKPADIPEKDEAKEAVKTEKNADDAKQSEAVKAAEKEKPVKDKKPSKAEDKKKPEKPVKADKKEKTEEPDESSEKTKTNEKAETKKPAGAKEHSEPEKKE
jgi:large subunit ribosomal protein L3